MIYKPLALISILLFLTSVLLFQFTNNSTVILLAGALACFLGLVSYKKNAASDLTFTAFLFSPIVMAVIFYLLTKDVLIAAALLISGFENHIKTRFLKFDYSKNLWMEPLLGLISISLYVAGNIQGNFGWQAWVFTGIPVCSIAMITFLNFTDRSSLVKTTGKGFIGIGNKAPDFELPDENGKLVSLSQYKGTTLLIVFVRGDWCPGCHIIMRTYEKNREVMQQKGVVLLCIGPDPVGVNKELAKKIDIRFHLLSDDSQQVAMKYTVELQPMHAGVPKEYKGIPLPASFIVDKEGIICFTSRTDNAGEIISPEKVFAVMEKH